MSAPCKEFLRVLRVDHHAERIPSHPPRSHFTEFHPWLESRTRRPRPRHFHRLGVLNRRDTRCSRPESLAVFPLAIGSAPSAAPASSPARPTCTPQFSPSNSVPPGRRTSAPARSAHSRQKPHRPLFLSRCPDLPSKTRLPPISPVRICRRARAPAKIRSH